MIYKIPALLSDFAVFLHESIPTPHPQLWIFSFDIAATICCLGLLTHVLWWDPVYRFLDTSKEPQMSTKEWQPHLSLALHHCWQSPASPDWLVEALDLLRLSGSLLFLTLGLHLCSVSFFLYSFLFPLNSIMVRTRIPSVLRIQYSPHFFTLNAHLNHT